jgi:superfamily II DNA or RNA helicase
MNNKPIKTIYGKKGYTLIKKYFTTEEIEKVKNDLTMLPYIPEDFGNSARPFPIYLENDNKLYIPKHYGFEHFGEPDQIKINKGEEINLTFNGTMKETQVPIIKAYVDSTKEGSLVTSSNGGLISVPCGVGKTACAINLISLLKRKALVIVHKEFLLNQWIGEIKHFLPGTRIGIIQGSKIDIDNKDIVIGMLQSISMKDYTEDTFNSFGTVVIDECHHISAEVFSRALPKINSWYSIGLSATPNRVDGLQKVMHYFLGPIIYRIDKRDDRKVRVNVIRFNDNNRDYCSEELSVFGKVCVPRMVTNIVNFTNRNLLINCIIKRLVMDKRHILVLSDRRDHLNCIYDMVKSYATVGYYVGGMKQKDLDISAKMDVVLGTYPMSSEGLNIPDLDAAVFTTSKSSIEQSIGRIIRKAHERIPVAFDIVDCFSVFPRQYLKREAIYKKLNYDVYELKVTSDIHSTEASFDFQLDKTYKKKEFKKGKVNTVVNDSSASDDDEDNEENTKTNKKEYCFLDSDNDE